MTRTPVAIVGAGLAGLCAARLLQAAGVDFVVIEARDRVGGRISSVDGTGKASDDGFDLGPSWFWPNMQPAMAGLVAALGLASFAQNSTGDVVFERMSREPSNRYRGDPQAPQSFRLEGGTAALVRALVRDLPPERVWLSARVAAMALGDDGVRLTVHRDGTDEIVVAGHVIAAVPPRLLEASVAFTPAQDAVMAARWRATPTWMAPHAKVFALYDRPFWREAGLSGTAQSMVGPMLEMHDATTASGQAALFGFVGVAAEQRATLGEVALTRNCLAQFARIFGPEALAPTATLLKDWAADPLTATPADRFAGGFIDGADPVWVTGPWAERLVLAGSETSPSEPGYLAGAVVAAERAVSALPSDVGAWKVLY